MSELISARVEETHISDFSVSIEVSGHRLSGDEPESQGGLNLAPSPYDYLTAALGECTAMTVRWYARQKNWPLQDVRVELTHERVAGHVSGKADIFRKSVTILGEQLSDEQRQRLHDIAAKCPVHKTLTGGAFIETLSEPADY
ncbi:OsmC family protein [Asticcacaulis excentricus]|nr:OsmC family protein [Asticcacaulis excentricus]